MMMAGSARPFMDWLREHKNGALHDELSDGLQELVAAVMEEGKAGTLTLTIKVGPFGKGDGALQVAAEAKVKPPKAPAGVSIFFATPENNLVRQDPRQQSMELREIAPAGVARSLA
jgi:hypothetical protein